MQGPPRPRIMRGNSFANVSVQTHNIGCPAPNIALPSRHGRSGRPVLKPDTLHTNSSEDQVAMMRGEAAGVSCLGASEP